MTQLNDARQRLEQALERLDRASRSRASGADDDKLVGELTELRQRNAVLEDRATTISDRLDLAIDRMKSALGG